MDFAVNGSRDMQEDFIKFLLSRNDDYNLSGTWGINVREFRFYDLVIEDSVRKCRCGVKYAVTQEESKAFKIPMGIFDLITHSFVCPECESNIYKTGKDLLLEDLKGFEAEWMNSDRYGVRRNLKKSLAYRFLKKALPFEMLDFSKVETSERTKEINYMRGNQLLINENGKRWNVQVIPIGILKDGTSDDGKRQAIKEAKEEGKPCKYAGGEGELI